jgi:hypothetical protein
MRGRKIVWSVSIRGFYLVDHRAGERAETAGHGTYATKAEAKADAKLLRRAGYGVKVEALNVAEEFTPQPMVLP